MAKVPADSNSNPYEYQLGAAGGVLPATSRSYPGPRPPLWMVNMAQLSLMCKMCGTIATIDDWSIGDDLIPSLQKINWWRLPGGYYECGTCYAAWKCKR
jgi:hypothetical protein